jgi:hypothetical protein
MSIAKLSDKMKKKLSFGDYALSTEPTPLVVEPTPSVKARKLYSLTAEDSQKLQEIFSKRLKTNPTSISELMSEAIDLLYKV